MKAVIQRVIKAKVEVENIKIGEINLGLLILLGVEQSDSEVDANWLINKILNLRIFADENKKMNLSIRDISAEMLIISQFTLLADCKKSNRPSFTKAAKAEQADFLYQYFVSQAKLSNLKIETGKFAADMQVELLNDGPVTIILDSKI